MQFSDFKEVICKICMDRTKVKILKNNVKGENACFAMIMTCRSEIFLTKKMRSYIKGLYVSASAQAE